MLPLHKLAARILGNGAAVAVPFLLLWFFGAALLGPAIFILALPTVLRLVDDVAMFKFVYENTKEPNEPNQAAEGTRLGSNRQGSL